MSTDSNSEENRIEKMTLDELKQLIPPKDLPEVEKQALESWLNAPLSNNDVFINFCNNKRMCEALVHILLKDFGVKINNPNIVYEKSENRDFDSKEVKFDLYIEDDYIIIDMEMQVVLKLMIPERIRTYQAAIDMEQIKKSERYNNLKNTFIIIICLDDPFGYQVPAYRIKKSPEPLELDEFDTGEFDISNYVDENFDTCILKDLEEFDQDKLKEYLKKMSRKHKKAKITEYVDGANIIFFNASLFYKVKNKELRTFLAFIMGFHFKDCEFYHLVKERFDTTKINEKVKLSYMTSYYRELDRKIIMTEELTEQIKEELTEQFSKEVKKLEEQAYKEKVKITKELEEQAYKEKVKITKELEEKAYKEKVKITKELEEKAYKEKVKLVINLINLNHSDEVIHSATGTPLEDISKIREENTK